MAAEEEKFTPRYVRRKMSADGIALTFTRSGNTYLFTPSGVAEEQARALYGVQRIGPAKTTAALKAKLESLWQQEDAG